MTIQSSFRKDEKYSGEWDRKPYFTCILSEINRVHTSHMYHTVTHKFVQFNNNKKAETTGLENYNRDVLTLTFSSRMAICTAVLFCVESPATGLLVSLPSLADLEGDRTLMACCGFLLWVRTAQCLSGVETLWPLPGAALQEKMSCSLTGSSAMQNLSDSLAASTVLDVMGGVMVSFMHQPG